MLQIRTVVVLSDGEVNATEWLPDDDSNAAAGKMLDAVRFIMGRRGRLAAAFWERRKINPDIALAARRHKPNVFAKGADKVSNLSTVVSMAPPL